MRSQAGGGPVGSRTKQGWHWNLRPAGKCAGESFQQLKAKRLRRDGLWLPLKATPSRTALGAKQLRGNDGGICKGEK